MKLLLTGIAGVATLLCSQVQAAPIKADAIDSAKMVLQLPLENRIRVFKTQGASAIAELQSVAFNSGYSLADRWRAVTVIARVFPEDGQSVLEKAMQSSEWFLRNAAAVGLKHSQRSWAIKWARILMHDPALVVRTSAVETLQALGAIEAEDLLWEKLYASENYSRGQSLWIRRHIAEALSKFARPGQEAAFQKILLDKDESLHPVALQTLNRIAGVEKQRSEWLTN